MNETEAFGDDFKEFLRIVGVVIVDRQVDRVTSVVHQALEHHRQVRVVRGGESANARDNVVGDISGKTTDVAP